MKRKPLEYPVTCSVCGKQIEKPKDGECGTGYGVDDKDQPVCYECCGTADLQRMIDTGRNTMYLTLGYLGGSKIIDRTACKITNWPGTLSYTPISIVKGRHNMAGVRYDAWFVGPDGFVWHGVQYGNNTQIIHCKRTKERRA